MSFLDAGTLSKDNARIVKLHEILIQAYKDQVDALSIAGSVGILQADIAVYPKMRQTWWSILEEAASDGVLRRLVYNVLQDPTVSAFCDEVRAILDIPETDLGSGIGISLGSKPHERGMKPTIGDQAPLWPVGQVLKVRFLDGEAALHEKVERIASQWVDYANIWFEFGDHPDAELRISFKEPGSWAYLGAHCQNVSDLQPNVNFGLLKTDTPDSEVQRQVLHVFGHVLGLQEEEGNPASTIKWNKPAVYAALGGAPSFWSKEQVIRSYFTIWPPQYYPFHKIFDPASIMMLPVPAEYLLEGEQVGWNNELSPLDKQFVAALYPQRGR